MLKIAILTLLVIMTLSLNAWAVEIDDRLVQAIIMAESSGNPNIVSSAGCVGLMQVSAITLKEYNTQMPYEKDIDIFGGWAMAEKEKALKGGECWGGVGRAMSEAENARVNEKYRSHNIGELFNPAINVKIGTWYLRRLRDYYLKDIQILHFESAEYPSIFQRVPLCQYITSRPPEYIKTIDDMELALILAAYNCGPIYLRKVNYDINKCPKETRDYIKRVLSIYKK